MEAWLSQAQEWVTSISPFYARLIQTGLWLLALWLLRLAILRLVLSRLEDARSRYNWVRFSAYVTAAISLVVVGQMWIERFETLVTYLGLVSAGIAIALGDLLKNLAGWLFIIMRRPFTLGDRIEIGNHSGDVIDIRIFQFTVLEVGNWVAADQSTGRIIHIPNGHVFTHNLSNFYRGFAYIWSELSVVITFESDWAKAKRLLQKIVDKNALYLSDRAQASIRQASMRYMIYYSKLTPIVYTSVVNHGVNLTLRYLTEPRRRRLLDQTMWEAILFEFGKHADIDFAYPTQRFFQHDREGKPVVARKKTRSRRITG